MGRKKNPRYIRQSDKCSLVSMSPDTYVPQSTCFLILMLPRYYVLQNRYQWPYIPHKCSLVPLFCNSTCKYLIKAMGVVWPIRTLGNTTLKQKCVNFTSSGAASIDNFFKVTFLIHWRINKWYTKQCCVLCVSLCSCFVNHIMLLSVPNPTCISLHWAKCVHQLNQSRPSRRYHQLSQVAGKQH